MQTESTTQLVEQALRGFLRAHPPGLQQVIHRLGEKGLRITNQPPIQSTPEGMIKFRHNLETIWLKVFIHGHGTNLAKLSQQHDGSFTFTALPELEKYQELVLENLEALRQVAEE